MYLILSNVNYRLTTDIAVGLRAGYVVDFYDDRDFDDGFSPLHECL
nr:hypothetical protein [uncultured Treponema sp.]